MRQSDLDDHIADFIQGGFHQFCLLKYPFEHQSKFKKLARHGKGAQLPGPDRMLGCFLLGKLYGLEDHGHPSELQDVVRNIDFFQSLPTLLWNGRIENILGSVIEADLVAQGFGFGGHVIGDDNGVETKHAA